MPITGSNSSYTSYTVNFFDKKIFTIVTIDPSTVSNWISDVLHSNSERLGSLVVGLDVEWGFSAAGKANPVSTVQICIGERCLIYQILHSEGDIPKALVDFLSNTDFAFVGVGVKEDLKKLNNQYGIGGCARGVELCPLAAKAYGKNPRSWNPGLKHLTSLVLGKDLEKPMWVTMGNWANRWLLDEQVQYACLDAYVSYEIGMVLLATDFDFAVNPTPQHPSDFHFAKPSP